MKILTIFFVLVSFSWGYINISLAKTLRKFNHDEYNVLLTPVFLSKGTQGRRTKKAIKKGYDRAIEELRRDVYLRGLKLNMKQYINGGSLVFRYDASLSASNPINIIAQQDKDVSLALYEGLNTEISILENSSNEPKLSLKQQAKSALSAKSVLAAPNLSAMEFSEDDKDIKGNDAKGTFKTTLIDIETIYKGSQYALRHNFSDYVAPFKIDNRVKYKNIHSIIGFAFFPTQYGRIKLMKMYIVIININTESKQDFNIIAQRIPDTGTFRWDRNYLYISGNTGKVLRQIVSDVLGETF